jgi:2-polyprenyl-3-methyl-5-hydroxy-6-metoxy-1,4-benzoquinol methylase
MIKEEYIRMYNLEDTFWWYKALHEIVEYFVKVKSNKNLNTKILDAGCGTGELLKICSNYGNAEGFDYSEVAIDFCKKRGLTQIFQIDLNDWDPDIDKYDIIICNDVLYHSQIKDDFNILNKFYNSLKANGILILSLPAFKILKRHHDEVVMGERRYKKHRVRNELLSIGYEIINCTYRLPVLFLLILIKKIIEKIVPPEKTSSDLNMMPEWINNVFLFFARIENNLIIKNVSFPFGSSLFIVAKKN